MVRTIKKIGGMARGGRIKWRESAIEVTPHFLVDLRRDVCWRRTRRLADRISADSIRSGTANIRPLEPLGEEPRKPAVAKPSTTPAWAAAGPRDGGR